MGGAWHRVSVKCLQLFLLILLLVVLVQSHRHVLLCNPLDCSMPGLPVPQHLLKFTQVHVHCIGDAIQPSQPLMPSSLASIFPSIRDLSNELAIHIRWPKYWSSGLVSVLPVSIWGGFPLRLTGLISLLSKGLSGVFSSTTVQRHQFFGLLPSLWSSSHIHLEDHSLDSMDHCWQSNVSALQHTV